MEKFTTVDLVFQKELDICEVDQFGAIDLRASFLNHVIPENVTMTPESFNGVEDAQSLLGRPSDVFDAIRKAEYVSRAASADKATEVAASTSSGTE